MKILVTIFIVLLLSISKLFAQWDNNTVCPGDSSHCEWRDTVDTRVQLSYRHDQYASVKYRYRYCNNTLEIDILSATTVDNADSLRTFTIEHYEFKSLRSALELGIITHHENIFGIDSLREDDPFDPNWKLCRDTVTWVNFFSASCGVFVKCLYRRSDTCRVCDSGYVAPYPEVVLNGNSFVVYTKWQKCGYNCCKKTYKICRDNSNTNSGLTNQFENNIPILRIIESSITSVSDCSLKNKYPGSTCYTNCWNNP